jgi:GAF domain-containing protein/HAMP domain-containing protein
METTPSGSVLQQFVSRVGLNTIRNRLLTLFIILVVLSSFVIGGVFTFFGLQSGRRRVIERLELAARFTEAEMGIWLDEMESELNVAYAELEIPLYVYTRDVLLGYDPTDEGETTEVLEGLIANNEIRMVNFVQESDQFDALLVLDLQGKIIGSTTSFVPEQRYAYAMYVDTEQTVFQMHILPTEHKVIAALPIFDEDEEDVLVGVLVGQVSLDSLNMIMARGLGIGTTGDISLVGRDFQLLASRFGDPGDRLKIAAVSNAVNAHQADYAFGDYVKNGVTVIAVYRWIPEFAAVLVADQSRLEAFRPVNIPILVSIVITFSFAVLAVMASLRLTQSITLPLENLAETASQVANGNLDRLARVERLDEVGQLAQIFNLMTEQLRNAFAELEQRVADRTHDLERRSAYLEASAQVGRAASSILDTDELLARSVDLIRERFAFYYVGLFLVDETGAGEWALLRAGTGDAGRAMIARGHRIRVGQGMIGWSIARAEARVALHAEDDSVRLVMPELPDTRSEAALPLHSRGRVLGALSVQSERPDAFDADTLIVLQTMADQVAVAIDNAHLFTDAQAALAAERRAYGQLTREAWSELLRTQTSAGYRYERKPDVAPILFPVHNEWPATMQLAQQTGQLVQADADVTTSSIGALAMPIRAGDQVIGVLNFDKGESAIPWTEDEVAVLETVADQLGQTLERAQLYWNTQRRAARDRLVGEVTTRMRESLEIDTVLQTTVREIVDALNIARVEVRLGTQTGEAENGLEREASV